MISRIGPPLALAALCLVAASDDDLDPTPLKCSAAGRFEIGVGTRLSGAMTDAEIALLNNEFSYLTPEDCLKPAALQAVEGQLRFGPADRFVDTATRSGHGIVGHCLVWARDDRTPEWFFEDGAQPASEELILMRMRTHIEAVVSRYADRVDQWDVVNEALDDHGPLWRPSGWQAACGPDFIVEAFKAARSAAPSALLIYNDYRCELPGKREKLLQLIRYLQIQGAPVDAIGLQAHYELGDVPYDDLDATLTAIEGLGLKVVISELDIDVVKRSKWWVGGNEQRRELASYDPYMDSCPPRVLRAQAAQYAELFEVFVKHKSCIERVTLWNLHDGHSWLNHFPWRRSNHPGLFDRQANPKPAYSSVQKVLQRSPGWL